MSEARSLDEAIQQAIASARSQPLPVGSDRLLIVLQAAVSSRYAAHGGTEVTVAVSCFEHPEGGLYFSATVTRRDRRRIGSETVELLRRRLQLREENIQYDGASANLQGFAEEAPHA